MQQRFVQGVLVCLLLSCSRGVWAFEWQSLWQRPDQRVQELIETESYEQAQQLAETPEQKALVNYRAGEYKQAAEQYQHSQSDYNVGTSLVRAGDYAAAIEAFDQVLSDSPEYKDAMANKKIAEQLAALNQQEQQQQSGEGEGDDEGEQDKQQPGDSPSDSQQPSDGESDADDSSEPSQEPQDSDGSSDEDGEDEGNQEPQDAPNPGGQDPGEPEDSKEAEAPQTKARDEKQQAMDQWLQQVPDDPAGLLRARIIREHQRSYGSSQDKEQAW